MFTFGQFLCSICAIFFSVKLYTYTDSCIWLKVFLRMSYHVHQVRCHEKWPCFFYNAFAFCCAPFSNFYMIKCQNFIKFLNLNHEGKLVCFVEKVGMINWNITDKICHTFYVSWSAGLLCDLLWSDPDKDVQGWGENDRGVSFTFGADVVSKFLNRHDLDLICRAHQVPMNYLVT